MLVYLEDTAVDHDHFAKQYSPLPIGNLRSSLNFFCSRHSDRKNHTNHSVIRLSATFGAVEQNVVNILLKCRFAEWFKQQIRCKTVMKYVARVLGGQLHSLGLHQSLNL